MTDITVQWPSEDNPMFLLTCPPEVGALAQHPPEGYRLITGIESDTFQIEPTDWGVNGESGYMRGRVLY